VRISVAAQVLRASADGKNVHTKAMGDVQRLGRRSDPHRLRKVGVIAALLLWALAGTSAQLVPAAGVYQAPVSGSWLVQGRGNGHGLGLSQYGAQQAAIQGLSSWQITNFYYQYTQLSVVPSATVRVALTDNGKYTVVGYDPNLWLFWPGGRTQLPQVGAIEWMLTPSGTGLGAFYLANGQWNLWQVVPSPADFAAGGQVRLDRLDGTSTIYRGSVGAVLTAGGLQTVNRVGLDDYVRGVVPREMPSGWMPAALQSQAIAARTYGLYAVQHNASQSWDICDSSNCQVYGGELKRGRDGTRAYGEESSTNLATSDTAGEVRTYNGSTIFAQYSSSNGGWIPPGTLPYAIAQPDRFEGPGLGDPWQSWTRNVSGASLAQSYGLDSVSTITITQRDSYGDWGGRVVSAVLQGAVGGVPRSVSVTGDSLRAAMNLPSRYFTIASPNQLPIGVVDSVAAVGSDAIRATGWEFDPDHPERTGIIDMFVDQTGTAIFTTVARPDVQQRYGISQLNVGFDVTVPVAPGTHRLCFYSWDLDGAGETIMSCASVTV
jgi:stage II sporulation protein D